MFLGEGRGDKKLHGCQKSDYDSNGGE